MKVAKLIKTPAAYGVVMVRIEAIFGAKPGTPEGNELDRLVTMVEVYENKAFPISEPGSPTEIRFCN
jgi:HTH-type transcriptional regulator/antitoxin HigA